jgi:hypothetical protein
VRGEGESIYTHKYKHPTIRSDCFGGREGERERELKRNRRIREKKRSVVGDEQTIERERKRMKKEGKQKKKP